MPTAERYGSEIGLSMEAVDLLEVGERGASSCHEAMRAQHGLPIAFTGDK